MATPVAFSPQTLGFSAAPGTDGPDITNAVPPSISFSGGVQIKEAPADANVTATIAEDTLHFKVRDINVLDWVWEPVDTSELPPGHRGPPPKVKVLERIAHSDGSTALAIKKGQFVVVRVEYAALRAEETFRGTLVIQGDTWNTVQVPLSLTLVKEVHMGAVKGDSNDLNTPAVRGEHTANGVGVFGHSDATAVWGESRTWVGVYGQTDSTTGGSGVWGESKGTGIGVVGKSAGGTAVFGTSDNGVGVWGTSVNFEGVHAETQSSTTAAMAAYQMNANSGSAAFFAKHMGKRTAGRFEGDVEVTGDIRLVNADCAEDFAISETEQIEPGTVMVLDPEGALQQSQQAYDKRVAGVISGAGGYKPGIILDRQESQHNRMPIALMGKVYCKVDADYAPIEVGDLLTSAPTPGHAMKADDPFKAFGAVIGKALQPLEIGRGLIPILVALQ